MNIEMVKFGDLLISRPAGKDAWLGIQSMLKNTTQKEQVTLDFKGVSVLTPSWMDEFYTPLKKKYKKVKTINIKSSVISETIKFLESLDVPKQG
jgi:hypothetical protein